MLPIMEKYKRFSNDYFLMYAHKNIFMARFFKFKNGNCHWSTISGSKYLLDEVTHWIPLPEQPKDE
jgi:Protein of unknown function (DUF551)